MRVENDEAALRFSGALILSLLQPITAYKYLKEEDKNERIKRVKIERIRFAVGIGDPIIQGWCDITGYSYKKVWRKILNFNK